MQRETCDGSGAALTASETATSLRGARLFRGVSPALVAQFANASRSNVLQEGEHVWRAGEMAHDFVVIQRGLIQIERRTASGDPAIVGVFGPRESIGDAAVLGGTSYPADAIVTSERVRVLRVPRDLVLHAMERDPTLAKAIQQALLEHTRALSAKIDIVSAGSVPARLATLLLHLAERFGDEHEAGSLAVPVSLSRSALAHLVAARVETVIRTLSGWSKLGVVRTTEDGFEITDLEKLRDLARAG